MTTQSQHTIFLDWLRFSVPVETPACELLPPHPIFAESGEVLTPHPNYNQTMALLAARVDWHTERPEQRKLVSMTGDDLLQMRRAGCSDDMLLRWVARFDNLNVARMDIAVDTRNAAIQPRLVFNAWQAGKLSTKAKKVVRVEGKSSEGDTDGYTVYIGSRSSQQFLRVYDKNAEQKAKGKTLELPNELWTRIELELKDDKAHLALRALAKAKIQEGGAIIGQFVDWPDNLIWQDVVSGNITVDLSVGRKETDRETWLRRVVFPNFEQALREGNLGALRIVEQWAERQKTLTR